MDKQVNQIIDLENKLVFHKNKLQYLIYLLNQSPNEDTSMYLLNKYSETYGTIIYIETILTYKGVIPNEKRNFV